MTNNMKTCPAKGWVFKCEERIQESQNFCFWHSRKPKTKEDIKNALEQINAKPKLLEGAYFYNSNLSGVSLKGVKLVETDFRGANLERCDFSGADLWQAKFEGAKLKGANFKESKLMEANFNNANLEETKLDGAKLKATNFRHANMQGISLKGAHFENTVFENSIWENNKINIYEKNKNWSIAKEIYQNLKYSYLQHGNSVTAGEFFYREKECERKGTKNMLRRLKLTFFWLFWGYGERPLRTMTLGIASIFAFAILYFLFSELHIATFWDCLYFSATSFTALGYGNWVSTPSMWTRVIGLSEAIFGVVMIASFVAILARKMARL